MNKLLPLIAFSVLLLIPIGAQNTFAATISTFDDKTAFLTATGATSATGPLPDLGLIPGGGGAVQSVGQATFSITLPSSQLFIGTFGTVGVTNNDWTLRLTGPDIAISDVENLNVDLANPVFSFGIDFVEPEFDPNVNALFAESTFTVTLLNGAVVVDSFSVSRPNDSAEFIGVWSDSIFDRVEIRETTGGLENEFFGQVYTGTIPLFELVAGEIIPIETTSLILAGLQTPAVCMISTLSALGIGAFLLMRNPYNARNIKVILRDYLDRF